MHDRPEIGTLRSSTSVLAAPKRELKPAERQLDISTTISLWAMGVLIMLHLMLRYPQLGALIERYNQF
jgi:hypothetical protein